MRYKRLLVIVVTILLFIPLFSFSSFGVSSTEIREWDNGHLVTDNPVNPINALSAEDSLFYWTDSEPYTNDFPLPAGEGSVICEFWTASNERRRVVFPSGSNVTIVRNVSTGQMSFVWSCPSLSVSDTCIIYLQESNGSFTSDHFAVVPPTKGSDGKYYLGTWTSYSNWKVVGYLCNQEINVDAPSPQNGQFKAFPTSSLVEEKKTQGMISQLISDIKDWFSNLIDSMGNFFTELANKISGFFTALGDKIGGFFTTLWNKIWWGNEAGESEYEPPDVGSKFDDVIEKLNSWLDDLKGFSDSINSQGDEVAGYLSTGSNFINTFLSVAPAPILIFLSFGVIFVVVRKVVGR